AVHGGHVVKALRDALCAGFRAGAEGVEAALDAQRALSAEAWGAEASIRVRMALHSGEAEEHGGDYVGAALNRVARLLAAAQGGQVLVSQAAADLLRESLPEEAVLRNLGVHRLRDLATSEAIFQLVHPALPAGSPRLRS